MIRPTGPRGSRFGSRLSSSWQIPPAGRSCGSRLPSSGPVGPPASPASGRRFSSPRPGRPMRGCRPRQSIGSRRTSQSLLGPPRTDGSPSAFRSLKPVTARPRSSSKMRKATGCEISSPASRWRRATGGSPGTAAMTAACRSSRASISGGRSRIQDSSPNTSSRSATAPARTTARCMQPPRTGSSSSLARLSPRGATSSSNSSPTARSSAATTRQTATAWRRWRWRRMKSFSTPSTTARSGASMWTARSPTGRRNRNSRSCGSITPPAIRSTSSPGSVSRSSAAIP